LFFQAEDGIRDRDVTGVQTCALPICRAGVGQGTSGAVSCSTKSVVDPGRPGIATKTALCYVYPVFPTPETRGLLPGLRHFNETLSVIHYNEN